MTSRLPLKPRRPLDDDRPEDYLESDMDYLRNNVERAVALLDEAQLHEEFWANREIKHEIQLRPCPSCGAGNVFLAHSSPNRDARQHVECRICQMRGPMKTHIFLAAKAWNSFPRPTMTMTDKPVAWCVQQYLVNGTPVLRLPFLTQVDDVERYRKANPDETLVPLYAPISYEASSSRP